MIQQSPKYLPYLDGWRGVAICFLLIGHFFPVPGINLGSAGVNLFFVLSGFLMARLLFVDNVPLAIFYKRRIARIFPAVFCFLTIATAAYAALGKPLGWTELAAAAAFVINYFPGQPGAAVMPFGHIWSLCVEEHSYFLLSVVALWARSGGSRRAVWAIGLLAALSAAIGIGYWLGYPGQHLEFDRWIHSEVSAYGILVSAFILLAGRGKIGQRAGLLVPALILGGFALHWWSGAGADDIRGGRFRPCPQPARQRTAAHAERAELVAAPANRVVVVFDLFVAAAVLPLRQP